MGPPPNTVGPNSENERASQQSCPARGPATLEPTAKHELQLLFEQQLPRSHPEPHPRSHLLHQPEPSTPRAPPPTPQLQTPQSYSSPHSTPKLSNPAARATEPNPNPKPIHARTSTKETPAAPSIPPTPTSSSSLDLTCSISPLLELHHQATPQLQAPQGYSSPHSTPKLSNPAARATKPNPNPKPNHARTTITPPRPARPQNQPAHPLDANRNLSHRSPHSTSTKQHPTPPSPYQPLLDSTQPATPQPATLHGSTQQPSQLLTASHRAPPPPQKPTATIKKRRHKRGKKKKG